MSWESAYCCVFPLPFVCRRTHASHTICAHPRTAAPKSTRRETTIAVSAGLCTRSSTLACALMRVSARGSGARPWEVPWCVDLRSCIWSRDMPAFLRIVWLPLLVARCHKNLCEAKDFVFRMTYSQNHKSQYKCMNKIWMCYLSHACGNYKPHASMNAKDARRKLFYLHF